MILTSPRGLAALAVLMVVVGAMLYLRLRGRSPGLRQLLLGHRSATARSGVLLCGLALLVMVLAVLASVIAPVGALFPVIGALFPYALGALALGMLLLWRARH